MNIMDSYIRICATGQDRPRKMRGNLQRKEEKFWKGWTAMKNSRFSGKEYEKIKKKKISLVKFLQAVGKMIMEEVRYIYRGWVIKPTISYYLYLSSAQTAVYWEPPPMIGHAFNVSREGGSRSIQMRHPIHKLRGFSKKIFLQHLANFSMEDY